LCPRRELSAKMSETHSFSLRTVRLLAFLGSLRSLAGDLQERSKFEQMRR
jgi:hypothetical protein